MQEKFETFFITKRQSTLFFHAGQSGWRVRGEGVASGLDGFLNSFFFAILSILNPVQRFLQLQHLKKIKENYMFSWFCNMKFKL